MLIIEQWRHGGMDGPVPGSARTRDRPPIAAFPATDVCFFDDLEVFMARLSWPAAMVMLGFIALVGVIFWRATADVQQFSMLWSAAGPIVGIVVGAIPGAAFGVSAQRERARALERVEVYARNLPLDRTERTTQELDAQGST